MASLFEAMDLPEEWKTNLGTDWLHIDQHPLGRPGKHCFQGVLNFNGSD